MAVEKYGCSVINKCILLMEDKYRTQLLGILYNHVIDLIQDNYGNYVIQVHTFFTNLMYRLSLKIHQDKNRVNSARVLLAMLFTYQCNVAVAMLWSVLLCMVKKRFETELSRRLSTLQTSKTWYLTMYDLEGNFNV